MKRKELRSKVTAVALSASMLASMCPTMAMAATENEASLQGSGYVLMNIPYDEFFAAEGIEGVDVVSTATVKSYNQSMAASSYHEGYEATDPISDAQILGVTYPVYVEDLSVLSEFTQVTDEDTATITVASGKSSLTEKEVSGVDLLFASGTYAYYVLSEEPGCYKTLTVEGDTFSFSNVDENVVAKEGIEVEMAYNAHYTDIEFNITAEEITDTAVVNAITLTDAEGNEYALRHVENIWRKTSLGWNWEDLDGNGLAGKTISKVTLYLADNGVYSVYEYEVNETVKLNPGTVTAAFEDEKTIVLTGLPEDMENAKATVKTVVGRGETATVIAEDVDVTDGKIITTDAAENGSYTISIISDNYGDTSAEAEYFVNPFNDVVEGDWYYNAVMWGSQNKVVAGITADMFYPAARCTRAQIVSFLWRAEGKPEASTKECPFTDVAADQWYYDAVLWATENKIVSGYSTEIFAPDATCTRAEMATFIWRMEGKQVPVGDENSFTDVADGQWFTDAAQWTYENGIVSGYDTTDGKVFAPDGTIARAETVTMLYRYYK